MAEDSFRGEEGEPTEMEGKEPEVEDFVAEKDERADAPGDLHTTAPTGPEVETWRAACSRLEMPDFLTHASRQERRQTADTAREGLRRVGWTTSWTSAQIHRLARLCDEAYPNGADHEEGRRVARPMEAHARNVFLRAVADVGEARPKRASEGFLEAVAVCEAGTRALAERDMSYVSTAALNGIANAARGRLEELGSVPRSSFLTRRRHVFCLHWQHHPRAEMAEAHACVEKLGLLEDSLDGVSQSRLAALEDCLETFSIITGRLE